ncbi:MAG: PUA domain-containing protein [Candidatus Hadarchaeales archaeon]
MIREPTSRELLKLRAVADYQFGRGTGAHLFPSGLTVVVSGGRIRQVWRGGTPLCSVRATDGFLLPHREGARILHRILPPGRLRVTVTGKVAGEVERGRTVFAKHVLEADPGIRPREEVLVVDPSGRLLATGTALLSGEEMKAFKHGKAVKVRWGMGGKGVP